MDEPPNAEEILRLRCQSRMGVRLHPEDQKKCEVAFNKYREWYSSTQSVVFERTKPYGS